MLLKAAFITGWACKEIAQAFWDVTDQESKDAKLRAIRKGIISEEQSCALTDAECLFICKKSIPQPDELIRRLEEVAAKLRCASDDQAGALWTTASEKTHAMQLERARKGLYSGEHACTFTWTAYSSMPCRIVRKVDPIHFLVKTSWQTAGLDYAWGIALKISVFVKSIELLLSRHSSL